MLYQYEFDYIFDSTKFARAFGVQPTSMQTASTEPPWNTGNRDRQPPPALVRPGLFRFIRVAWNEEAADESRTAIPTTLLDLDG